MSDDTQHTRNYVARYIPEEELMERALKALIEALGPVEAIRFLNLPRPQRLESVERHQQWQDSLSQEQFLDEIFGSATSPDQ